MKKRLMCAAALVSALTTARGQGLLSIGPQIPTEVKSPWSVSASSTVGWDSNPFASASSSSSLSKGSSYLQEDDLTYSTFDRLNKLSLSGDYSGLWYANVPPGDSKYSNNWKLSLSYFRQESRQWTITDEVYLAHQTQPDLAVGLTLNRPTTGSLVLYNAFSLSYDLSRVSSLVTSYTITEIGYDDPTLQGQNYLENAISEQFRYQMTRRTTATVEIRCAILDYEHMPDLSSKSAMLLLGMDHQFSRFLQGTFSFGVESRLYNGPLGRSTNPNLEAALVYHAGKHTTWRWYVNMGANDTGSTGEQSGYSYLTGLSLQHELTARLSLTLSMNFNRTIYSDSGGVNLGDDFQDTFGCSIGLRYALWENVYLTAGFSYSDVTGSTRLVPAYRREQINIGLNATF